MLATVDSSEDASLRVQVPTIQFTRVGELEDALTNFHCRTVNFIEEEDYTMVTGFFEPVRCVPASGLPIDGWKTHKVTFRHLRCTAFDDGQVTLFGKLVYHFRLADSVTASDEDGETSVDDVSDNRVKGSKIDGHV